jgi:hypothetical protein
MGVLPQSLEIIFEAQRKLINAKITRKKNSFPTYKMPFFSPLFGPLTFKPHTFLNSDSF